MKKNILIVFVTICLFYSVAKSQTQNADSLLYNKGLISYYSIPDAIDNENTNFLPYLNHNTSISAEFDSLLDQLINHLSNNDSIEVYIIVHYRNLFYDEYMQIRRSEYYADMLNSYVKRKSENSSRKIFFEGVGGYFIKLPPNKSVMSKIEIFSINKLK